jgi:hypothetical protein
MHIGGNIFIDPVVNENGDSYYFSRSGHIWGWATWRRAWKMFDLDISLYEHTRAQGFFDNYFLNRLEKFYRLRKFNETVARRGTVDWWDYQWDFARYINSGLAIVPMKNLVRNLGFGEGATHTVNSKSRNAGMTTNEIRFPLRHPEFVFRDVDKDRKYFRKFIKEILLSKVGL